MQELKELVYLDFLFLRNRGVDGHMKERVSRENVAMRLVWGLGKKSFADVFRRRMKLFQSLVMSVLFYVVGL